MSRFYNRQAKAQWPPRDATLDDCLHQLRENHARLYRFTMADGTHRWQVRGEVQRWRRDLTEADALVLLATAGIEQVAETELGLEYAWRGKCPGSGRRGGGVARGAARAG